jgi:hypothetical protein
MLIITYVATVNSVRKNFVRDIPFFKFTSVT